VISYVIRSNLRFLIDVTPAIVGSANKLIYVRVGLGWAHAPEPASVARATAIRFSTSKLPVDEYGERHKKHQVGLCDVL
jgi:hypothetical protein